MNTYLIVMIPLVLNVLAIIGYRRWFRIAAALVLPFTTLAAIFDCYSASQKGNLTGLVTLFISGPALIVLALLGLGNLVQKSRPSQVGDPSQAVGEPITPRTARGVVTGAVLAVSGMIFIEICAFIINIVYGEVFLTLWLRAAGTRYEAWVAVAAIGALVGGANSFYRRAK